MHSNEEATNLDNENTIKLSANPIVYAIESPANPASNLENSSEYIITTITVEKVMVAPRKSTLMFSQRLDIQNSK
jgi:hypothetical protein